MLLNDETLRFIRQHACDDVRALALHARPEPGVDLSAALTQIAGLQTLRAKVPAWASTEGILCPARLSLEQCSSEATARYKARLVAAYDGPRHRLADLTGGLGIDCSFLAPLFDEADYVERQASLCQLAAHNLPLLGLKHVRVHCADGIAFLADMPAADWIFLDPARRDSHGGRTVALADCEPDVSQLEGQLLERASRVLLKLSGEALMGEGGYGIDPEVTDRLAHQVRDLHDDGIEVGVMMPASGKPILYATAVSGQFATEEAARIREKEMMSSFRADSDSVGQAKVRAEKLRSSLYNTMIGRTPMSRGYEASALKKTPKDKLTDGDKKSQVKNISTKDMELAIQEKGLKYVREFCKDQWIRAGGPERRMEGTNIFITPPGYTRYKPWGIGSALEMGSLNMALNDSLKARPGKDGKMKQDKSRPAPGRNPYKIHYAIDYPKADGTRGSYEALTLLASDSPKETFFEAERRSILEMVGEPERSRLMAEFGIDMEITPKEPLKDGNGKTIAEGAAEPQSI